MFPLLPLPIVGCIAPPPPPPKLWLAGEEGEMAADEEEGEEEGILDEMVAPEGDT